MQWRVLILKAFALTELAQQLFFGMAVGPCCGIHSTHGSPIKITVSYPTFLIKVIIAFIVFALPAGDYPLTLIFFFFFSSIDSRSVLRGKKEKKE